LCASLTQPLSRNGDIVLRSILPPNTVFLDEFSNGVVFMRFAPRRIGVALISAVAVWFASQPASAQILDESIIDYRQEIMKTKDAQARAIGAILTGTVPDANLTSHFEALLLANRQARKAFETPVEGGKADPAIWKNWNDFSGKLDRIEAALVKAIEATREHGPNAAGDAAVEALNCAGCHDVYRKP